MHQFVKLLPANYFGSLLVWEHYFLVYFRVDIAKPCCKEAVVGSLLVSGKSAVFR